MKSAFGIMMHHFHGKNHPASNGSISDNDLDQMLTWLKKKFNILNIVEFYQKALKGKLAPNDTCLTFDDSLLCQYEIALPLIESHDLTALFNVYSSAFSGKPDPLEIHRYFRNISYKNFDDFFNDFIVMFKEEFSSECTEAILRFSKEREIYDGYPFYTDNEKVFRFCRDKILGPFKYNLVMTNLINEKKFDISEVPTKVFMTLPQLVQLNQKGHALGLHSDTHPTQFHLLPQEEQVKEYTVNYDFLKNITDTGAKMMAHPCGQYSATTLEILNQMELRVGFRDNYTPYTKSLLEIPREDHSNIMKNMLLA